MRSDHQISKEDAMQHRKMSNDDFTLKMTNVFCRSVNATGEIQNVRVV